MKRVTAIVRPEKMEALKDALFAADVSGMTISQVHGCGAQHGWSEYVRGTEVLLNMVPKVKFEIVGGGRRQDIRGAHRGGRAHPHRRAGRSRCVGACVLQSLARRREKGTPCIAIPPAACAPARSMWK